MFNLWHSINFKGNNLLRPPSTRYGILMKDIDSYKSPFGLLDHIANTLFIKIKITEIFDYRAKVIENIFQS